MGAGVSNEEMVAVNLGDDYDKGPFFTTDWGPRDYLIPRSQLERWEAAEAAHGQMQTEIDQIMDEQSERIREINAARPKTQLSSLIEQAYSRQMAFAFSIHPLLRGLKHKEPE